LEAAPLHIALESIVFKALKATKTCFVLLSFSLERVYTVLSLSFERTFTATHSSTAALTLNKALTRIKHIHIHIIPSAYYILHVV